MGDSIKKKIKEILNKETINLENETTLIEKLVEINEGDLRKILTQLEILKTFYGETTINLLNILDTARIIPNETINSLMKSDSIDTIIEKLNKIFLDGHCGKQLLLQIFDYVLSNNYNQKVKKEVLDTLALCEYRINHGADELIQITNLLSFLVLK
jgi:DNA polymerase III delta prime subunit